MLEYKLYLIVFMSLKKIKCLFLPLLFMAARESCNSRKKKVEKRMKRILIFVVSYNLEVKQS